MVLCLVLRGSRGDHDTTHRRLSGKPTPVLLGLSIPLMQGVRIGALLGSPGM